MPKRVRSWRGLYPCHCARKYSFERKIVAAEEICLQHCVKFLSARDLNLRPPVPETNALPLDCLPGTDTVTTILTQCVM